MTTNMAIFRGKSIRKTLHNNELWFSVVDAVEALTDSHDAKQYIKKMRQRDQELVAEDGKKYETDCINTERLLSIIQSGKIKNEKVNGKGISFKEIGQ